MNTILQYKSIPPFNCLREGMTVVFSKTPTASWTTAGQEYVIEWKCGDMVYFRNKKTGSGTYDPAWAVNQSIFHVVANNNEKKD